MPLDYIIAGLGNPGDKYMLNRHNIGFMTVDYMMQKANFKVNRLKFKSLCGEFEYAGHRVLVMKPQTYMNNSGEAIHEAAEFYKIAPSNIIVINDDISLPIGRMRIRKKGSDGGHNGLKNIICQLDSDAFPRIKIGVGGPPADFDLKDWVTGDIPKADREAVFKCIENTYEALLLMMNGETDKAMNTYNN